VSIATKRGDEGQTSLPGGARVSKADLRVECYGAIDELISQMGLARSICEDREIHDLTKQIQRELFRVGSGLGTPPESARPEPEVTAEMVEALGEHVHRIEAMPGVLTDWSLPGELPVSAAFDLARVVCRRAERLAVRLRESGSPVDPQILAYLNRLSDLLWLMGRLLEARAGADSALRPKDKSGARWSRAW